MSSDNKPTEKSFEFPMMPIFGVDLGERLGEFAAGQKQMRGDIQELKADVKGLEAKTDKMANAIHRLDERTKSMQSQILVIGGGTLVAVLAGIVLQFFFK